MLKRTVGAVPELLCEITATWSKGGTSMSLVSGENVACICVYLHMHMAYTCFIFTVSI